MLKREVRRWHAKAPVFAVVRQESDGPCLFDDAYHTEAEAGIQADMKELDNLYPRSAYAIKPLNLAAGTSALTFDHEEARGTVALTAGSYGPTLTIDGKEVGYIDLCPPVEGDPAQVLFFSEHMEDEPLCKVVMEPGGIVVVVNAAAVQGQTQHTTHSTGDRVYAWPAPG